jgi:hypothetical protein
MRAMVVYGADDVHVESVPNTIVRMRRAAIYHRDLWPYQQKRPGETDFRRSALSTLRHTQQEETRQ